MVDILLYSEFVQTIYFKHILLLNLLYKCTHYFKPLTISIHSIQGYYCSFFNFFQTDGTFLFDSSKH